MRGWGGRALLVIGAAMLATGLANVLIPQFVFPSTATCVTDYDVFYCLVAPWPAGPWISLVGALVVAAALIVLRGRPPVAHGGATGQEQHNS